MMKRAASSVSRPSVTALILWLIVFLAATAAEPPSPVVTPTDTSNTNVGFSSAIEALGLMIQMVGNLEETVQKKDLASIHSEDLVLNESLAAILQQADRLEPAGRKQFRLDVTQFGQHVGSLHFAG